jgi:hypothetical protein
MRGFKDSLHAGDTHTGLEQPAAMHPHTPTHYAATPDEPARPAA